MYALLLRFFHTFTSVDGSAWGNWSGNARRRARAADLAAQLGQAQDLLQAAQQREQDARAALAAKQAGYARLADELASMRRFSMQAVDAVRGETREVRERCAYLDGVLRKKEGEVDMYRQLALGGKR